MACNFKVVGTAAVLWEHIPKFLKKYEHHVVVEHDSIYMVTDKSLEFLDGFAYDLHIALKKSEQYGAAVGLLCASSEFISGDIAVIKYTINTERVTRNQMVEITAKR